MSYRPIRVEFINPFVASAMNVFKTVLSCDITRLPLYKVDTSSPRYALSGIIGLSGQAAGVVVLKISEEVALFATETMLGERPPEVNADVIDAVGEIANMIAGGAKAKLDGLTLTISLPSVVSGKDQIISLPSEVPPVGIPFESPYGKFAVEVSLAECISESNGKPIEVKPAARVF